MYNKGNCDDLQGWCDLVQWCMWVWLCHCTKNISGAMLSWNCTILLEISMGKWIFLII